MCNNWDKYLLSLSGSDSWTALEILSSVRSSQFGGKWSIRAALSCLFISPPRRLLSHFLSTNQQLCYHTQSLDHSHGRLVDQWYALCWNELQSIMSFFVNNNVVNLSICPHQSVVNCYLWTDRQLLPPVFFGRPLLCPPLIPLPQILSHLLLLPELSNQFSDHNPRSLMSLFFQLFLTNP